MENVVEKPWGCEIVWAKTSEYAGKVMFIRAGESSSFHYHNAKDATLLVIAGRCKIEWQNETEPQSSTAVFLPGDSFHIPPLLRHRVEAIDDVQVVEVSNPHTNEIVRLEDRYGRMEK